MGRRSDKIKEEEKVDVTGTIKGFITEEQSQKTQEQEILDYKEKKKTEKLRNVTQEEIKRRKEKEDEEEEKLKRIKQELLQSLKVRIPEIERKFFAMLVGDNRDKKFSEKENIKVKDAGGEQPQKQVKQKKQEGHIQETEQEEREQ